MLNGQVQAFSKRVKVAEEKQT